MILNPSWGEVDVGSPRSRLASTLRVGNFSRRNVSATFSQYRRRAPRDASALKKYGSPRNFQAGLSRKYGRTSQLDVPRWHYRLALRAPLFRQKFPINVETSLEFLSFLSQSGDFQPGIRPDTVFRRRCITKMRLPLIRNGE